MADRSSVRAIAQAFWEWRDGELNIDEPHCVDYVERRARELDAAEPHVDPDKYPSTRPADQLPNDVLIEVALQSAGRTTRYDNAIQHCRLQECRSELLRRLAVSPEDAPRPPALWIIFNEHGSISYWSKNRDHIAEEAARVGRPAHGYYNVPPSLNDADTSPVGYGRAEELARLRENPRACATIFGERMPGASEPVYGVRTTAEGHRDG